MNLLNFGREQLQKGMLNEMLSQVGIDDVGSFVQQFREEANHEANTVTEQHQQEANDVDEDTTLRSASNQQANLFSMGSSILNKVCSGIVAHFIDSLGFSSPALKEEEVGNRAEEIILWI